MANASSSEVRPDSSSANGRMNGGGKQSDAPAPAGGLVNKGDVTLSGLSGIRGVDIEADSTAAKPEASLEFVPSSAFSPDVAGGASGGAAAGAGDGPTWSDLLAKTMVPGLVDKQRYKITGEFARGGMGRILLAFDRATGREVAIKELIGSAHGADPEPAGGKIAATGPTLMAGPSMVGGRNVPGAPNLTESPPPDEITVERFLREAKITSRLEHPNIVPVYEIARRPDGVWYYTMKFVRGVTLSKRLRDIQRDNKLDPKAKLAERIKLLAVFIDVCNAVAFAHSKGVVHRDLKPDNIMVGEFGETVVLDWGLAHVEGEDNKKVTQILSTKALKTSEQRRREKESAASSTSARLTMMGSVIGTPSYMPPEQAMGKLEDVDETSDTYALGTILYELLSGQRAYPGDDAYDILDAVLAGPPRQLATIAPDVPPELVAVVEKAMARDKPMRFQNAHDLGFEIRAWRDGRAVASYKYSTGEQIRRIAKRHRAVVTTISAALLVLLIGGALSLMSISAERDEAERQAKEASEQRATAVLNGQIAEEQRKRSDEALTKVRELEQQAKDRFAIAQRERIAAYSDASATARVAHDLRPIMDRARICISAYEADKRAPISAAQKLENENCMAALTAAIQAHALALKLATDPIENQAPRVMSSLQAEDELLISTKRKELGEAKQVSVKLALANRDHGLARHLLATITPDDADAATIDSLTTDVETGARAILEYRKGRITAAIDDIKRGMMRKDRAVNEPLLDDYVFELAGYRDHQTVELLKKELDSLAELAKTRQLEAKGRTVTASVQDRIEGFRSDVSIEYESWSTSERDMAKLCLRVLPRLQLPDAAIEAIRPLSESVLELQMLQDVVKALSDIGTLESYSPIGAIFPRIKDLPYSGSFGSMATRAIRRLPDPRTGPLESASLYSSRSFRYRLVKRYEEALADIRMAVSMDKSKAQYVYDLVLCLILVEEYQEALESIEQYEAFNPGPGKAASLRSYILVSMNQSEDALVEIDKAIAAAPSDSRYYGNRAEILQSLERWQDMAEAATKALKISPSDSYALMKRAIAWDRLGEDERAAADINRMLKYDPWNTEGLRNRFVMRLERGDYQSALDDISRCIELEPNTLRHYLDRAKLLRGNMNDPAAALMDAQTVLDVEPDNVNAILQRAPARYALGDKAGAMEDMNRAVALGGDTLALAYSERGWYHNDSGDSNGAMDDYNKSIETGESGPTVYTRRGSLFLKRKQYQEAIRDYREAVKRSPDEAIHHHHLALGLRDAKQYEEALQCIQKSIDLSPLNDDTLAVKAQLLGLLGRRQESIDVYTEVLRLNPLSVTALVNRSLAKSKGNDGDLQGALDDLNRAAEIDPKMSTIFSNRSLLQGRLKDSKAAMADAELAIKLDDKSAHAYVARGDCHMKQGDSHMKPEENHKKQEEYQSAKRDFEKAIELNQDYAFAWSQLGWAYYKLKSLEESLAAYKKTCNLEPDNDGYWYLYGLLLIESGKSSNIAIAIDAYTQAISISPDISDYYSSRAKAHSNNWDYKAAALDYDKAVEVDKTSTVALNRRASFREKCADFAGALEDVNEHIRLEPDIWGHYHYRAFLYSAHGDNAASDKDVMKAKELGASDSRLEDALKNLEQNRLLVRWFHKEPTKPEEYLEKAYAHWSWGWGSLKRMSEWERSMKAVYASWKTSTEIPEVHRERVYLCTKHLARTYRYGYGNSRKAYEWYSIAATQLDYLTREQMSLETYNTACEAALIARELSESKLSNSPADLNDTVEYWTDLAFEWLDKALDAGWHKSEHIENDKDWPHLHDDERWGTAVRKCKMLEAKAAKKE